MCVYVMLCINKREFSRSRDAIASDVVFGLYPAEPSVARTEPPHASLPVTEPYMAVTMTLSWTEPSCVISIRVGTT